MSEREQRQITTFNFFAAVLVAVVLGVVLSASWLTYAGKWVEVFA